MKLILLTAFIFCNWACVEKIASVENQFATDEVEGRSLQVYLPPSYQSSDKRYPVVYIHDGQQWQIHDLLDDLIKTGKIEEIILVGIFSSNQRTSEYLPYQDDYVTQDWGPYTPKAKQFSDFVVQKIIPYIDGKYRTIKDRKSRAIMGSSFGGLLALWMGYNYDDYFSMVGALSPSFWVADMQIFKDVDAQPKKDLKVWFDLGTLEWNYYIPLSDILSQKGYTYGADFLYYEVDGGRHDPNDWIARIAYPLIFFHGKASTTIADLNVKIEVIKSFTRPVWFLRLNPVVEMDNGLKYSLAQFAKYELLNPSDGVVNYDGSFRFNSDKDLHVNVKYQHLSKPVTISYQEVESRKRESR
ncbi:hypothetical protein L0337_15335 [candidate division KSB1 bacterium]|nr:hypothetical protein [candidate division KSB1 bacterium]